MLDIGDKKQKALLKIANIASQNDITIKDIASTLNKNKGLPNWLLRTGIYIGAVFVLSGMCLLVNMFWGYMDSPMRVIATYGVGMALFVFGIMRRDHLLTPLIILSAAFLPFGMFVFLKEYSSGGSPQLAELIIFTILCAQYFGAFIKFPSSVALFFGVAFGVSSIGAFTNIAGASLVEATMFVSITIIAIANRVLSTPYNKISGILFLFGSVGLMSSIFELTRHYAIYDLIGILSALALLGLGVFARSTTLIVTSMLGVVLFLGYYSNEYFKEVVGWPVVLIGMGIVLMAGGAIVVRILKRINAENKRFSV